MLKKYKSLVSAEKFEPTSKIIEKYNIETSSNHFGAKIFFIPTRRGRIQLFSDVWILTQANGDIDIAGDSEFHENYQEVGTKKKIVKAVQFDSWDEDMMQKNYIDNPDYGIYLTYINGLQVYLNQGDWIVTYQDGSQDVIPDDDWETSK